MPRTNPVSLGLAKAKAGCHPGLPNRRMGVLSMPHWVAAVVALTGVAVGCDSSAGPATTTIEVSPPTATIVSTVPPVSSTLVQTTVAVTVPDTAKPAPTTTEATAPPTTSVEDEVLAAVARADLVMKNCLKAGADCDRAELETALVGVQLEGFPKLAASAKFENVDAATWTVLDEPTLVGDELAVVEMCAFDPMVVTYPDARVDAEEYYFRQEWQLLPVGRTWKLAEIITKNEATTEQSVCDR